LLTLLEDSFSNSSLVIGSEKSSRSKSSSSFVSYFVSSFLSDELGVSMSSVRFFLGAGALLFGFGFVTLETLPFKASFCLARAYSFASFSSFALHSAM
jgi:hypothetical protein